MLVHSTVCEQQKTSVEFMKALGLAPNLTMKYFTTKAFCANEPDFFSSLSRLTIETMVDDKISTSFLLIASTFCTVRHNNSS